MEVMNAQKLAEAFRKMQALQSEHIGSNGDAHLTATGEMNGFMAAADKYQVDSHGRRADGVDSGKDLLTLPYGIYAGRNFVNAPSSVDGGVCIVEISGWDIYKIITFFWPAKGFMYTRSIAGTSDSGWQTGEWIDVAPVNGFTGKLKACVKPTAYGGEIQVIFDLTCSITSGVPTKFTTLPDGYKPVSSDSSPTYFVCRAVRDNDASVPVGIVLGGGNELSMYRVDGGGTTGTTITKISGLIKMSR